MTEVKKKLCNLRWINCEGQNTLCKDKKISFLGLKLPWFLQLQFQQKSKDLIQNKWKHYIHLEFGKQIFVVYFVVAIVGKNFGLKALLRIKKLTFRISG